MDARIILRRYLPDAALRMPDGAALAMVIRLKKPRGIDFPSLLPMIPNSFISRASSTLNHGTKPDLAMQFILTPLIPQLMERKRRMA
jgi:phosphoribulokinase